MPRLSDLRGLTAETAFTVLALARAWKAKGKEIVELEIGDSPFPSPPAAKEVLAEAIAADLTGYCPSLGLLEFREGAARWVDEEFNIRAKAENVVVASARNRLSNTSPRRSWSRETAS